MGLEMLGDSNRRNSNLEPLFDGLVDGCGSPSRENGAVVTSVSSDFGSSSSSSGSPSSANYFEHRVSKFDTLAGIAIKYGVEVSDIRRINGLVSDLQMFAYKTLQIPLNGRHPPPHCPSNGSIDNREHTPLRRPRSDVLDLLESLNMRPSELNVSQSMNSLQGYCGLPPVRSSPVLGGPDMAVYRTGRHTLDNGLLRTSAPRFNKHRKSRSLSCGVLKENSEYGDEATDNSDNEKYFKRRQKSGAGFDTPEKLLKEDNSSGFCVSAGKGLALRPKLGSQNDMDSIGNGNAVDNLGSVRKSSSTSCLQDSDSSYSIWLASMWPLKVDAIAMPILYSLPNRISVWRNKAARD